MKIWGRLVPVKKKESGRLFNQILGHLPGPTLVLVVVQLGGIHNLDHTCLHRNADTAGRGDKSGLRARRNCGCLSDDSGDLTRFG